VEVDEAGFSDDVKQLQALAENIQRQIKDYFTVSVKVKLVEPRTIPRSEGKAKRPPFDYPEVQGPEVAGGQLRPAEPWR
jgi:hypothetical protein